MGLLDKPSSSSPLANRAPGMKPKWTKDDARLMAKMLLFFVGMFSLASFFKGDGLIAGALAGVALWLITTGALGYVAFWTLRRRRRSEGPRARKRTSNKAITFEETGKGE